MTNKWNREKTTGSEMVGATWLLESDDSELVSAEVTKKIRKFFQRASDNGTLFYDNGSTLENDTLINSGITLFQQIKNAIPLTMEGLYKVYEWSSGQNRGGWGTFEVNLPKEDIEEFQSFLNDIFTSPEKYKHSVGTEIQQKKIKGKYWQSNILDKKELSNGKTAFLLYVFQDLEYHIKFIEMTDQKDSQVFELDTFEVKTFHIDTWNNLEKKD